MLKITLQWMIFLDAVKSYNAKQEFVTYKNYDALSIAKA
jgi:hypothetical protein